VGDQMPFLPMNFSLLALPSGRFKVLNGAFMNTTSGIRSKRRAELDAARRDGETDRSPELAGDQ
jgi:hypothetical protein